jgi:hypothetical protein
MKKKTLNHSIAAPLRSLILIILVSTITSITLSRALYEDRRLIRPEEFIGISRLPLADAFIKRLFPIGTDITVFKLVMNQSGLKGIQADREAIERSHSGPLRNSQAVGYLVYYMIAACPEHRHFLPPACELRFFAEFDEANRIVAVYAGSDKHDL